MSWLHCFWGLGAIFSPFVMSWALTHLSWQAGYRIIGFVQLGIALVLTLTLPVWKVNGPDRPQGAEPVGTGGALRIPGVPSLLLGFFAYCSAEATAMGWASTYMVTSRHFSAAEAARFAALFYIGITVGRFLAGFISERLGDHRMIRLGTAILLCGIAILLLPLPGKGAVIAGFVIIGLGCAPVYPSIIHSTPDNFGSEVSGAIIGIQMASAYVGSTFMPPLYGLLGNALGFGILPVYLTLFVVLMIVMVEMTFSLTRSARGERAAAAAAADGRVRGGGKRRSRRGRP